MKAYRRTSDIASLTGRGKGAVTTIHNAIAATATSAAISTQGYNAIMIESIVTVAAKNWTTKLQGCLTVGGTYTDLYDGATLMSFQTNSGKIVLFKGLPPYIKIVATEDEDTGKVTVKYQLMNVNL